MWTPASRGPRPAAISTFPSVPARTSPSLGDDPLHHRKRKVLPDYVVHYTNASFIVGPDFISRTGSSPVTTRKNGNTARNTGSSRRTAGASRRGTDPDPSPLRLPASEGTLFPLHPGQASSITGVSKENLLRVYEAYSATGVPDKAGTECYALVGRTHTTGSQNIRTMSIIQLLLGNMGICGGGINALRGEPNVQGSTDHAILYNHPARISENAAASLDTLDKYLEKSLPNPTTPSRPTTIRTTRSSSSAFSRPSSTTRERRKTVSVTPGSPSSTTAPPIPSCTSSTRCTTAR